jgi:hypothetical protein
MAPTPADAPRMVEGMLNSFLSAQTVNTFPLPARPGIQNVLNSMRGPGGTLDLNRPAFRLLAIMNRIDLHDATASGATTAGEGRFVFGFAPFGQTLQATLIIEYNIPASSREEVVELANAWHALREHPFPSPEYNAALQAVTDRFTSRDAAPGRPNGSALGQIRTNDFFAFGGAWEFREFHLSATDGMLVPAPVAQTPDRSFNFTTRLGQFVTSIEQELLTTERHVVPLTFDGVAFQGGNVDASNFFTWQVPNVSPELRHRFARNTCNGCHTFSETAGAEFQIRPRFPFQEAPLSRFLTGGDVTDFQAGVIRHFNELRKRGRVLHDLVCPDEILPPLPPDTTPIGGGPDGGMTGVGGTFGGSGAGGSVAPPPPPRDGGMPPPPPPRGGAGTGGPITGAGGMVGSSDGGI